MPEKFIVSDLVKATHPRPLGEKTKDWWLNPIDDLESSGIRVKKLTQSQKMATDNGAYSFDLVVDKIISSYTPDKNPYIDDRGWIAKLLS